MSSEDEYYEQDSLWRGDHGGDADDLVRFTATDDMLPPDLASIADLGAGDGRLSAHLVRRGRRGSTVVVDRSLAALRRYDGPCVAGSVDGVPIRGQAAEAVLCCEVLEHLPEPVFHAARQELARVARRHVFVSVPNRENRRRAELRCPACNCAYNPVRHLRSFTPEAMADLIPGFDLVEIREVGPRVVIYPRLLRTVLERVGILQRGGAPICPQCGVAPGERAPAHTPGGGAAPGRLRRVRRIGTPLARRLAPKSRRRYWLCALYTRSGS